MMVAQFCWTAVLLPNGLRTLGGRWEGWAEVFGLSAGLAADGG